MRASIIRSVALLGVMAGLASLASAQQINAILQNESTLPSKWRAWNSIYGTNLPNGSGTYVSFNFRVNYPTGIGGGLSIINSQSQHNTVWWYDSPTQLNFWPYPQNYASGTPASGCYTMPGSFPPITVCNDVKVCQGGMCAPSFSNTFTGAPGL